MKRLFSILLLCLFCSALPATVAAQGTLRIVTTLPDLQSIAEAVGGDRVDAMAIATGYQNPHFVDPKPSYIVQLSRADVFITIGLDLETGWVPALLNSARNADVQIGGAGYVDASKGIPLLQVPSSTSREQGDIHIYGNPHYWLDPDNGKIIARTIRDAFVRLQPESESYFNANLQAFTAELDRKIAEWDRLMAPYKGSEIIAYHNQWPYFADHFGLTIVDFLEPKPGIPPTPNQLAKVIGIMKNRDIHVLIISPYYRKNSAELVAKQVGGTVVEIGTSVGAFDEIQDYFDLFDVNVQRITAALSR